MARPPKTLPSDDLSGPTPSEIVEREAPVRRYAIIGAGVAVVLTVIAVILEHTLSGKVPDFHQSDLIQTLSGTAAGTPAPRSFLTAVGAFKIDHAAETTILSIVRGVAFLFMLPIIVLLLRAARVRGGTLGRFLEPIVIVGFALMAIGTVMAGFLEPAFYRHAKDMGFTPGDIRDAYKHSSLVIASIPLTIGALCAGVPLALGSIQSVRVGLLTPVIGYMGVLIGMLFILPFEPTGILRAVWLSLVAGTLAGGMGGLPQAWTTGTGIAPAPRTRQPGESMFGKKGAAEPEAGSKKTPAGKPKGVKS